MHKLKRDMGQQATKNFSLFTNKAKERSIIGSMYPETTPNAIMIDKDKPIEAQITPLDFPVMLKPIAGVGSRGVMKAFSMKELEENIENLHKTFDVLAAK
jgi:biotin carboxylase